MKILIAVIFGLFLTGEIYAATVYHTVQDWIIEQVKTGEVANLKEKFPEKNRILSVDFLEKLLSEKLCKVPRQGVGISGAIIKEEINWRNIEVKHEVWLENFIFEKKVNLKFSVFSKNLGLRGSEFKREASLDFMKVKGSVSFEEAVFQEGVSSLSSEFGNHFIATKAEFNNPDKQADFNNMKVGGIAFFEEAVFQGGVSFLSSEFGSHFIATKAEFNNPDKQADFNNMKVGGIGSFRGTAFQGGVSFLSSEFGSHFIATKAEFNNPDKQADFNIMKVGGIGSFRGTAFQGEANFRHAEIKHFSLNSKTVFRKNIYLEGLVYKVIDPEFFEKYLKIVDRARFFPKNYQILERNFRKISKPDLADQIIEAQKTRERKELFKRKETFNILDWLFSLSSWLLSWFLKLTVNNGLSPGLTLIWAIGFIIMGSFVFREKENMIKQSSEELPYCPISYSIDSFIPFLDLGIKHSWMPRGKFLRFYMIVHTISGWVLISVLALALAKIVK